MKTYLRNAVSYLVLQFLEGSKLTEMVQKIKDMSKSIDEGEITVSAYDTAWVALIKDVNGDEGPQFPSSIEWIVSNQLPDGSWGDAAFFSAHDRMINTLACVIVLTSWKIYPENCNRGTELHESPIFCLIFIN
jgi:ent-copalyl diphosphate synthase